MLKLNDLNIPATIAKRLLEQHLTLARTSLANVQFTPKERGKFWHPLGVGGHNALNIHSMALASAAQGTASEALCSP